MDKSLEDKIAGQNKTTEKLIEMGDKIRKQEYDKAKLDLTAKQIEAVQESDIEKWKVLETEKDNLEKPEETKIDEPAQERQDPDYEKWLPDNDWYLKDEEANLYADACKSIIHKQNPTMPYAQMLNEITEKVKVAFPHKFKNPNRTTPAPVDTGNQSGNNVQTTGKSYSDMPKDAKDYCDSCIANGLYKDAPGNGPTAKEQFVNVAFA